MGTTLLLICVLCAIAVHGQVAYWNHYTFSSVATAGSDVVAVGSSALAMGRSSYAWDIYYYSDNMISIQTGSICWTMDALEPFANTGTPYLTACTGANTQRWNVTIFSYNGVTPQHIIEPYLTSLSFNIAWVLDSDPSSVYGVPPPFVTSADVSTWDDVNHQWYIGNTASFAGITPITANCMVASLMKPGTTASYTYNLKAGERKFVYLQEIWGSASYDSTTYTLDSASISLLQQGQISVHFATTTGSGIQWGACTQSASNVYQSWHPGQWFGNRCTYYDSVSYQPNGMSTAVIAFNAYVIIQSNVQATITMTVNYGVSGLCNVRTTGTLSSSATLAAPAYLFSTDSRYLIKVDQFGTLKLLEPGHLDLSARTMWTSGTANAPDNYVLSVNNQHGLSVCLASSPTTCTYTSGNGQPSTDPTQLQQHGVVNPTVEVVGGEVLLIFQTAFYPYNPLTRLMGALSGMSGPILPNRMWYPGDTIAPSGNAYSLSLTVSDGGCIIQFLKSGSWIYQINTSPCDYWVVQNSPSAILSVIVANQPIDLKNKQTTTDPWGSQYQITSGCVGCMFGVFNDCFGLYSSTQQFPFYCDPNNSGGSTCHGYGCLINPL